MNESKIKDNLLELSHTVGSRYFADNLTFLALIDFFGVLPGCNKTVGVSLGLKEISYIYFLATEIKESQNFGFEILTDKRQIDNFLTNAYQTVQILEVVAKKLEQLRIDTATEDHLADAFKRSISACVHFSAYYQLTSPGFSDALWKVIQNCLELRVFDSRDVLNCLTAGDTSQLKSFQEMESWLGILLEYFENSQNTDIVYSKLVHHAYQFGFLGIDSNHLQGLSSDYYLQKLLATKVEDLNNLLVRVEEMKRRSTYADEIAATCGKRIGLPEDLLTACRSIGYLSISRFRLREAILFHRRAVEPLTRRIYGIIDQVFGHPIPENLKRQLTIEEIEKVLKKSIPPSLKELQERFEITLIELSNGRIKLLSGNDAKERLKYWHLPNRVHSPNIDLQGKVVYGENTLVAQALVLRFQDMQSVVAPDKQTYAGRIVITHMTLPKLIPICVDAAAILTEEGGLTSHAAVLAREFGIPCVVGVRGVTQAFESGEWLEISFSTGCIRKIDAKRGLNLLEEQKAQPTFNSFQRKSATRTSLKIQAREDLAVVNLNSPEAASPELVGGKAANLNRIHTYTPPGFVITTVGIRYYLLSDSCQSLYLGSANYKGDLTSLNPPYITHWSSLRKIVKSQLDSLGKGTVAVRSSDYNEDSERKSYAGLFQSFIDIDPSNLEVFWQAVSDVVASALGQAVTQYKDLLGSSGEENTMAVLVQRMVQPLVSGVALTSIRRSEQDWLLLEYKYGPLAPLVSGIVSPERSAMLRSIFLSTCHTSEFAASLMPPGLEAAVGIDVVNQLGSRIADVEEHFREPLEIEWAVDADGSIWILQARPITTKHHVPGE